MRNEDMQAKLKTAFEHATPDVLGSVLSDIESGNTEKNQIIVMGGQKNMKNTIRNITAVAAAAVLLIGGAAGFAVYNTNYKVASTISLDVNPSVEITANKKEDVLAVTALNDDGRAIIGDMDFSGSSIDVTVNALIGSMLREGYLSDLANSILISVDDSDAAHGEALQKKLADDINAILQTNAFDGAVLSQTLVKDSDAWTLAEEYGITAGKAQLVNEIVASNPTRTFEELAPLSINELNLLSASSTVTTTAESVGQASDKAYIGSDRAKEIAFEHAGYAEADVYGLEIEMDYERGVMIYEVDFHAGAYEYDYDINAETGEIVKNDYENDDDWFDSSSSKSADRLVTGQTAGADTSAASADYLTLDEVKAIVFEHAGVTADTVFDFESEFDHDDGRAEYEIDFESGEYDYCYDIDAVTGEIIKNNKKTDPENLIENGSFSSGNSIVLREEDFAAAEKCIEAGDLERLADIIREYGILVTEEELNTILLSRKSEILTVEEVTDAAKNLSVGEARAVIALIDGADAISYENAGYISADKAKEIALSHAGVHENNIFDYDCEFEHDDGRAVYEIDFESMNYEHDYDIDAFTGEIIRSDKEIRD